MLTIFLCENNPNEQEKYASAIEKVAHKYKLDMNLYLFDDSKQLIFNTIDLPDLPDIIYINPDVPGLNGIDAARYLRAHGTHAAIIFLGDSGNHVFEAFDVAPVNFLIKDRTGLPKFEQVFLKAVDEATATKDGLFVCETGGARRVIELRDIEYFEIYKRVITVYVEGKQNCSFYGSMEQLEKKLNAKNFLRIHRSYLVGLPHIVLLEHHQLTLYDGTKLPIGITYTKAVREKLLFYSYSLHKSKRTG